ncbi:hypothetical protein OOJ91_13990 [Micromonospora lupini]|uniref:hypothetical protein n=1 Tax=Micromonospora lupini TaxID=285679 RepID=UPI00225C25EA|nr:hypothetical protein [Micromonospora lupini]MCX5066959.1 hypothetical protein [Micromonospora lupini]
MTHPAPHPGTPTPPAGPSRINLAAQFASFADVDGRAKRTADAKAAGSHGHSASPLSGQHRADNYRRQTGRTTFTPKQWRRFVHKAHKAGVKVAVA